MTFDDFKDEVYTMLGDSMVEVELSDKDIEVALKRAIRTFKQRGPDNYRKAYYCFPVYRNKQEYVVPAEIDTAIKIIRPNYSWFSVEDPLAMSAYNNLFAGTGIVSGTGDWLSLEMLGQQMEKWQRYMAHDVDFNHDKMRNTLRLLQAPRRDERWILEVYTTLSTEEYTELLWVQNWAISEAKIILGSAYSKFSSLPGPDGSVSMNGDQMIQGAKEEQRQLLEDIENQVSGDVDWYGVYVG